MQKIKIRKMSLTINVAGLILACLLVGGLLVYVAVNRACIRIDGERSYTTDQAEIIRQEGNAELSWEFRAAHKNMNGVYFRLTNAQKYAQEKLTITVENNRGFRQSEEYVIQGQTDVEDCAIGLSQAVGIKSTCRISVSGREELMADMISGTACYQYYDLFALLPLFIGCVMILLNVSIRMEDDRKWCRIIQAGYKILSLAAIPVLLIYSMEYLSGSIEILSFRVLFVNIVICACLYLLVFIITNRLRFTVFFTSCMVYALAIAEYFVLLFRGTPLNPYDIKSLGTALSVVEQYRIEWNEKLVFTAFIFIAVISAACRMSFKIKGYKKRLGFGAAGVGVIAGMVVLFYGVIYDAWELSYSTWAPADTYMNNGYFMSNMIFVKYAALHRPEGYSAKKAREILKSFETAEEPEGDGQPVNLIVVMNESWSTLEYVNHVQTNISYNAFYQSLQENTIKGNLYVSICGGNTPQTEYEFFTGNSISMLPSGATAYEFFVNKNTGSICDILKQENYICRAIHPFGASGYDRDKAYEKFGFDEFITQEAFAGYDVIRSFYSDEATYEKIIELYEGKNPQEKLFIWDLTMQNHGGYITDESFEKEVYLTDYPELEQASVYLTLMKYTDEALEMLISYFEKVEEPTMIVMFGDHQPALSDGTYETLYGAEESELDDEERERRYITPFLIWNNYGLQEEYIEQMSANYLSSYMMQQAGFPSTAYQNLLLDLYQSYPVINAQGVYDSQGQYWRWDEVSDSSDYEKISDYQIVEYYMIRNGK